MINVTDRPNVHVWFIALVCCLASTWRSGLLTHVSRDTCVPATAILEQVCLQLTKYLRLAGEDKLTKHMKRHASGDNCVVRIAIGMVKRY